MNTVVIKRGFYDIVDNLTIAKSLALAGIIALIFYAPTRDILLSSLSEAYYQVSVFVAATLMGLMLFERVKKRGMHEMLSRHSRWQVLIAAVLGAVPGCGGSIFVVTQYIRGSMSFGGGGRHANGDHGRCGVFTFGAGAGGGGAGVCGLLCGGRPVWLAD